MKSEQSELLTSFYRAYQDWINAGAPNHKPFRRDKGLCFNLFNFCRDNHLSDTAVSNEMNRQFKNAGMNYTIPFSKYSSYHVEVRTSQCHINKERLTWVKDHLQL